MRWLNIPLKRSVGGPRRADFLSHVGALTTGGGSFCKTRLGGVEDVEGVGGVGGVRVLRVLRDAVLKDRKEERWGMERRERAERMEPAATRRWRRPEPSLCTRRTKVRM